MEHASRLGLSLYRFRSRPGPAAAPLIARAAWDKACSAYRPMLDRFQILSRGRRLQFALGRHLCGWLGADPFDPGNIHGIAPYGRVAFQTDLGGGTFEAGAFALKAALFPERDRSSGRTNRYTDIGVDASWIKPLKSDMLTLNARYTHEKQSLDATCALGMADGSIEPGRCPLAPTIRSMKSASTVPITGTMRLARRSARSASAARPTRSFTPTIRTLHPNSSGF